MLQGLGSDCPSLFLTNMIPEFVLRIGYALLDKVRVITPASNLL